MTTRRSRRCSVDRVVIVIIVIIVIVVVVVVVVVIIAVGAWIRFWQAGSG